MPRRRQPLIPYTCPFHPARLLLCTACLGQRAGRRRSPAQLAAVRRNIKKTHVGRAAARARRREAQAQLAALLNPHRPGAVAAEAEFAALLDPQRWTPP